MIDSSPPTRIAFEATDDEEGWRLDQAVASRAGETSRTAVKAAIIGGAGSVNGVRARPARRIHAGDQIEVLIDPVQITQLVAQDVEFSVIEERSDVVVIDKPAGILVHPGAGHPDETLANGLLARYPQIAGVGGPNRPGIVHRLDKDTSGVMLVALSGSAYLHVQAEFAARRVRKIYLAIVSGVPSPPAAVIEAPIGRSADDRLRHVIDHGRGRPATTRYLTLASAGGLSLLELELFTGRTHQARIHLAAIGCPVLGDRLYGSARGAQRQMLHASELGLTLADDRRRTWRAAVPADLLACAEQAGLSASTLAQPGGRVAEL